MYTYAHRAGGVWAQQASGSSVGYASLDTQHRLSEILRHARTEGLAQLPLCGGIDFPHQQEGEGVDPIPLGWIGSVHITPEVIEVEVPLDTECAGPVAPAEPGNIDIWPEDDIWPMYNSKCTRTESEAMEVACQVWDGYSPDDDPTTVYPSVFEHELPAWGAEGEVECEEGSMVCHIIDLQLWPLSPATEPGQVFEISCAEHPELCELTVELLDPTTLAFDEDGGGGDEEQPWFDEGCEEIIADYNAGGACTAAVAKCSTDGDCMEETDDGYVYCQTNNVEESCTSYHDGEDTGEEPYYEVEHESSGDSQASEDFDEMRASGSIGQADRESGGDGTAGAAVQCTLVKQIDGSNTWRCQ